MRREADPKGAQLTVEKPHEYSATGRCSADAAAWGQAGSNCAMRFSLMGSWLIMGYKICKLADKSYFYCL